MNDADDIANKLNGLKDHILLETKRIQKVGLDGVIGELKNRIFLDGEATNGSRISALRKAKKPRLGDYSRQHGRKRQKRSRPTDKVNLFLEGDLFRDLVVGENNNNIVMGFANDDKGDLAGYHEDYRKQIIFHANDSEIELITEACVAEAQQVIEEYFNKNI